MVEDVKTDSINDFEIVDKTGYACIKCKRVWPAREGAVKRGIISCATCHHRTKTKAVLKAIKCGKCDKSWTPAIKMLNRTWVRCRFCTAVYIIDKSTDKILRGGYVPEIQQIFQRTQD